jgi:hypothetical protein
MINYFKTFTSVLEHLTGAPCKFEYKVFLKENEKFKCYHLYCRNGNRDKCIM